MSGSWPVRCYIGLGGNLGDPRARLEEALRQLAHLPLTRLEAVSPFYRNPPLGPADQPDYVNAVARLETRLSAVRLLRLLQAVEERAGRRRSGERWGPRTLDLDLLLYGDRVMRGELLTIPHPGVAVRAFVLRPLYDLDPALVLPDGRAVAALLGELGDGELVEVRRDQYPRRGLRGDES